MHIKLHNKKYLSLLTIMLMMGAGTGLVNNINTNNSQSVQAASKSKSKNAHNVASSWSKLVQEKKAYSMSLKKVRLLLKMPMVI